MKHWQLLFPEYAEDTDILVNFKHFKNDTETMQCERTIIFSKVRDFKSVTGSYARIYIHFNAYL